MNAPFKILAIDGGGIRGVIPASVLIAVEKKLQAQLGNPSLKIGDCFDLVAGTSTGGILTCLLLAPDRTDATRVRFNASEARNLYLEYGDDIFDRSVWQRIKSSNGVTDEKYSAEMLERILLNYFGDLRLSQLARPSLITAFQTKQYRPFFFTQHDAKNDPASDFLVREVARATSAAPTYFQTALVENLDDIPNPVPMIDGGVFANNPAACALVEAMRLTGTSKQDQAPATPRTISNFAILSLGTGRKPNSITYQQCKDWGMVAWLKPVLDILMEGVAQTVDYQLRTIFDSAQHGGHYLRIDGNFSDVEGGLAIANLDPAMDCATAENLRHLQTFGDQLANNFDAQIDTFVKTHWPKP